MTTALERPTSAASHPGAPHAGAAEVLAAMEDNIWRARCWRDLDSWVDAIRLAFEQGEVDAFGVEGLMQQAIRVSRLVPEG